MTDYRISDLPSATAPLSDTDLAAVVQTSASLPNTRRTTIAALRNAILLDRPAHVRDFGAVGDGVTNDAPAIQAAVNYVQANGGGTLEFGPHHYRLASAITVQSTAITLAGAGFEEAPSPGGGTWFMVDSTGFVPITFQGVATRGSVIRDIACWQQQPGLTGGTWSPTDYDYVFKVLDCLGSVDFNNVFFAGITRGVYADNSGRVDFRRIRGQFYTRGITIDRCYDTPRMQNLHFWPFATSDARVMSWTQQNCDLLTFFRVDGVFIDQYFGFGSRSALYFSASDYGHTTKFNISTASVDFCKYGLLIDGAGVNGQIGNLNTQHEAWPSTGAPLGDGAAIRIATTGVRLQIGHLYAERVWQSPIRVEQSDNRIDLFSYRADLFNWGNDASPAIAVADSGSATRNRIFLGSPALLNPSYATTTGPASGNGVVAMMAPAGSTALPGLAVGAVDTGLSQPASGAVSASASGSEIMRFRTGGTGNYLQASSANAGSPPVLAAVGADTTIPLYLTGQGSSGSVHLRANSATVLRVDRPASGDSSLLLRSNTGNVQALVESTATDASLNFYSRGAGAISFATTGGGEQLRVQSTASAVNYLAATGGATGNGVSLAAQGSDSNVDLLASAKGTSGSVRLQANGTTVMRVDNPNTGNSGLLVRNGTAAVTCLVESPATNAKLSISGRGTGGVQLETSSGCLGFFGTTPAARPTVSGSRAGNPALTSLLAALNSLGLITDSSVT